MKRNNLEVCGLDILTHDSLPGVVLIFDSQLENLSNFESFKEEVCETLLLPERYASLAVPLESWEKDVLFHSGSQSQPFSCARVPVIFVLSGLHPSKRYSVSSRKYDPLVHIGQGERILLKEAIGLSREVYGLEVAAHNRCGILAACRWMSSHSGATEIARKEFELFCMDSSDLTHSEKETETIISRSLVGLEVIHNGETMKCISQTRDRVCLQKTDGKKIWRAVDDVTINNVHV